MSLKLVELQVALPRTIDSSKLQEQLQQRSQHMQDTVVVNSLKDDELKRKQVTKNEENDKTKFQKDQSSSSNKGMEQNKKDSNKEKNEENLHHPYKGNFIDFIG